MEFKKDKYTTHNLYNCDLIKYDNISKVWNLVNLFDTKDNDSLNKLNDSYSSTQKDSHSNDTEDILENSITRLSDRLMKTKTDDMDSQSNKDDEYSEEQEINFRFKQNSMNSKTSSDCSSKKIDKSFYFNTDYYNIKSLKLLTYNIWFDEYNYENRWKNILSICEAKNPDIICLQEVTDNFYEYLLKTEYVKDNFYLTMIPSQLKNWYETLIMSKYMCNAYTMPFISRMGRKLLYITIVNNSSELIKVGTTHLESLNNCNIRENQLYLSYNILDSIETENIDFKTKHSFLMGDFNFTEKETPLIAEKGYIDVGNQIIKKTTKHETNKEKKEVKEKQSLMKWCTMKAMKGYPAWRPDRLTYKTQSKSFSINQYEIVGRETIKAPNKKNPVDTPSDHYGIYVECNL